MRRLGDLVLGQRGEEARRRPALLVGPRGQLWPDQLDGGQAEVVEGQRQAAGVDRIDGAHAASPRRMVASEAVPRTLVGLEWRPGDGDIRHGGGAGCEAGPQFRHVGQAAGLK